MVLESKAAWVSRVPRHLPQKGMSDVWLWLDKNGNSLKIGEDFSAAQSQDSYPVHIYRLQRVSRLVNDEPQPKPIAQQLWDKIDLVRLKMCDFRNDLGRPFRNVLEEYVLELNEIAKKFGVH